MGDIIVPKAGVVLWEARSVDDMADGLKWMKDTLGISDKLCDELAGLTEGHVNKLLGPTRYKKLGATTIPLVSGALGVKWVMMVDEDQMQRMEGRWEARREQYVQPLARAPSKQLLERAKPHVLSQLSALGNAARSAMLPEKQRKEIARKAAKARWSKKAAGSRGRRHRAASQSS
jgi:hypothetical protein